MNPYMDTSVCHAGKVMTVCKYGKSIFHGDFLIIPGMAK